MDSFSEAEASFLEQHPDYWNTTAIEALRHAQYEQLDRQGHCYLDYTGAGLYASTQIQEHMRLLLADIFGNPHSSSPASAPATRLLERAAQYMNSSTRPRMSTLSFSRATRPARSNWWANPIHSTPPAVSC